MIRIRPKRFAGGRVSAFFLFCLATLLVKSVASRADEVPGVAEIAPAATLRDPLGSSWIDFDTAAIWRMTHSTDLDYLVLPQILSWRSGYVFKWQVGEGDLILRNRLSLLAEYFAEGPENYYLGFSGSPSLEWWNADRGFSLFFAAGGGVGWVDSTDVEGGQGQDFTFNWFVHTGARFRLRENLHLSAGLFFQHLSNRGLDDRNPGLDALGPSLGLSWKF